MTRFHDRYLKVPYVKDGCSGTVCGQRTSARLGRPCGKEGRVVPWGKEVAGLL